MYCVYMYKCTVYIRMHSLYNLQLYGKGGIQHMYIVYSHMLLTINSGVCKEYQE